MLAAIAPFITTAPAGRGGGVRGGAAELRTPTLRGRRGPSLPGRAFFVVRSSGGRRAFPRMRRREHDTHMIRIAMPNKGRLADEARDLLERAGLDFEGRGERALQASLADGMRALFVRARDIPDFVADGVADVGITGLDLIEESGRPLEPLLDLGFGRCRLVVAVREDSGIHGVDELPEGTRVATTFPRLTSRFFADRGRDVTVVPISGAVEIVPHLGVADIIVDLASTGSTLKMNGLRAIETVLESSAMLVANHTPPRRGASDRETALAAAIEDFRAALESVIRARDKRYLMANVPRGALDEVKRILPGISGPTIVDVLDGGSHVAAHAVVDRRDVYRVISELKGIGAEGILLTRIERLMP